VYKQFNPMSRCVGETTNHGCDSRPSAHRLLQTIPQTFEELGISQSLVLDRVLRCLLLASATSVPQRFTPPVHPHPEHHIQPLRQHQLVEMKGMLGNH
jgi:hypothetical protein